jgi:predicted DNA-binding transcriptional regulator AlpA
MRSGIEVDDLVGMDEISERTGTSKPGVQKWTCQDTFPIPVYPKPESRSTGKFRLWLWPDIVEWMQTSGMDFRAEEAQAIKFGDA